MTEPTKLAVINERAELDQAPTRDEQMRLLREAAGGGALNDKQFALLVEIARRTGLDILRKQIYGVVYKGRMSIIVGIDGLRAIARRNGLAGVTDATYTHHEKDAEQRWPMTATVTVKRLGPTGIVEEYTSTARWREFAAIRDGKPDGQWAIRPHVMLAKCAEAQALRKGFAESLAGLYAAEEMGRDSGPRVQQVPKRRTLEEATAPKAEAEPEVETIDEPPDGEGYYPDDDQ
jgi:phage recombination protein Bet